MPNGILSPIAGHLKVPERDEKKEEWRDGGDKAVTTHRANNAELKVYKIHRRSGAQCGVKNCSEAQAARERIESKARCQSKHEHIIDKAEVRHRRPKNPRVGTINDNVASINDGALQRRTGEVAIGNIGDVSYADEREREHAVRRQGDFNWAAAVTGRALVQGSVPEHFITEPFNFLFQMRLAAPEFDEHLAVFIRAME
jgi:hypothetical protein